MNQRLKKNTAAEEAYVRDIDRCGPLEKVERGEARILAPREYPEPIKRFLNRERRTVRVKLSPAAKTRLDRISRDRGIGPDELARRWVEQALAREAGARATPFERRRPR
jgi:hypothetical protein